MRLWSLHPSYLDPQGLVALWREALLAQKVLRGQTRGYRHHPQLERFKAHSAPVKAIGAYLGAVQAEAARRGYSFDRSKIRYPNARIRLGVTRGQMDYERRWLLSKLKKRDAARFREFRSEARFRPHPVFRVKPGPVAAWEKVQ
jgi:hypothetical protein